ncbi:hypothetical protein [Cumulibacter soli]|uniref:hypothetical protein n=1 Tax=Cumulibacter soli TaxID=2546344 RepID=UPI0010679FBC|nr:hypothetical protein [Cumulibacter soli]
MDPVTLGFLIVGAVGLGVLLLSLVVGDLIHLGDVDADGPFSLPAIAAYVGGVGFFGAIAASIFGSVTPALIAGLLLALPLAFGAVRLTRSLSNMRTDRTLTEDDLAGALGVVITPIPAAGYGEVRINLNGTDLKYSARADQPIASGTPIFVINALSATSVEVVSTGESQFP